jgi:hypothetical protein
MRTKMFVLFGVVLIVAGAYALIRPNVMMPAQRQKLEIAGHEVEMETRRIIPVPRPMSGLLILSGVALILLSTQKP